MLLFEVIDDNSVKWNEIVKRAQFYDFHHTAYFHKIDNNFTSKLLYCSDGDNFLALPIVIRTIDNTDFFDITSVYGYAGPVFQFNDSYNPTNLITFFKLNFLQYCDEQKIISVFSRLHPLMDQKRIFSDLGEIVDLNKTVTIDLTLSSEEQRKDYRKSLKSELNQLRKKGIVVKETTDDEDINKFIEIYYETMDRVEASSGYYFSKDYFYEFLKNKDFDSKLLIAKKDDKVIAGAIFTFTESIIQYHLAGTTEAFISEAPMKLILDEARLLGNQYSANYLHLGGGVGGQDDDSLFRFKSAFSKQFKQFSVWKYIHNPKKYQQLCMEFNIPLNSNFFPAYRA